MKIASACIAPSCVPPLRTNQERIERVVRKTDPGPLDTEKSDRTNVRLWRLSVRSADQPSATTRSSMESVAICMGAVSASSVCLSSLGTARVSTTRVHRGCWLVSFAVTNSRRSGSSTGSCGRSIDGNCVSHAPRSETTTPRSGRSGEGLRPMRPEERGGTLRRTAVSGGGA
jgi:hypothetical protein